jgi:hypothetical protein
MVLQAYSLELRTKMYNESNGIYIVSTSWFEGYSPTIVQGPKVQNWTDFCMQLIQIAAKKCLESKKSESSLDYITVDSLKVFLIEELKIYGYSILNPDIFNIHGDIVDSDQNGEMLKDGMRLECAKEIEEHNDAVSKEIQEAIDRDNR